MVQQNQNASLYSGTDHILEITVYAADGTTPLDISGAAFVWRLTDERDTVVIEKTVGDGIEIVDGAAGRCNITLGHAETARLVGQYPHHLKMTDASGRTVVVLTGELTWERLPDGSM